MYNPKLYAVIMAGGSGTRLWPLSRKATPKQMLNLLGERSMFQMAVDRLLPILPPDQILIVTTASMAQALQAQTPNIPTQNFLLEPKGRGTAAVIGLGALVAERMAGEPVIITCLTADHHIAAEEKFRHCLLAAAELAQDGSIVTLGVTPTYPSTGYGYIELGLPDRFVRQLPAYRVQRFREKPLLPLAKSFVEDGNHVWNSGMFIWSTSRVRDEFERQLPQTAALLARYAAAYGTDHAEQTLNEVWEQMPNQTIDYGIMESAQDIKVIPVDFGWSDIGSWEALLELLDGDENGNVSPQGEHLAIQTYRTFVHSNRLVVTIGLDNMIVVDTPDALLVCPVERAQDVKLAVDALSKSQHTRDLL
jgi:mannose-1-phosphate guanylyltransferase